MNGVSMKWGKKTLNCSEWLKRVVTNGQRRFKSTHRMEPPVCEKHNSRLSWLECVFRSRKHTPSEFLSREQQKSLNVIYFWQDPWPADDVRFSCTSKARKRTRTSLFRLTCTHFSIASLAKSSLHLVYFREVNCTCFELF